MILYILYRIGRRLALTLPLKVSYRLASCLAGLYALSAPGECRAVADNIAAITGGASDDGMLRRRARAVFRNFGKYLVDFFRFEKLDRSTIGRSMAVKGVAHVEEARRRGRGTILLSAHMGSWELGGALFAMLGYPVHGVVLTHANPRIDAFFRHQRLAGGVQPVTLGFGLKSCYRVLKGNGFLALLGDRDFTATGIPVSCFGRTILLPRGPALLSHRLGAAIVPAFLIREPDDTLTLHIERPIYPEADADETCAVADLIRRYFAVIESYIVRYPEQWYIFKRFWSAR